MKVDILARSIAAVLLCTLLAARAHGETPWAQALAAQALENGFLSRLPPNLSAAFGLAKPEQGTEVRQLIARAAHTVKTFNVGVVNHGDLVIFDVDEHTNMTTAYLLAPDGQLRKAMSYRSVDQAQPLTTAQASAGFLREKRFWSARVHKGAAAATH